MYFFSHIITRLIVKTLYPFQIPKLCLVFPKEIQSTQRFLSPSNHLRMSPTFHLSGCCKDDLHSLTESSHTSAALPIHMCPHTYCQYFLRDSRVIRKIPNIYLDSIFPCPGQRTRWTALPHLISKLKVKGGNPPGPSCINSWPRASELTMLYLWKNIYV